jgi:CMP-N,N'-diacetyllegionaminic acid synthase
MIKKGNVVCIVPARNGSVRVPNKNLKEIGGTSLLLRAVQFAGQISETVIISTDIPSVIEGSSAWGDVDVRPFHLCGSDVRMDEVLFELLERRQCERLYDYIILLQPTSPFRKVEHVLESIDLLSVRTDLDMVMSVTVFAEDLWLPQKDGILERVFSNEPRIQQLRSPKFIENGNFYVIRLTSLLREKEIARLKTYGYETSGKYSVDINTETDFQFARSFSEY